MKCVNERMVYQIEISSKFPRELELVINLLWPIDYDEFWQKQNYRVVIEQKCFYFVSKYVVQFLNAHFLPAKNGTHFIVLPTFQMYFLFFLTASLAK